MTKLGITRLLGESEDDFRRRYGREKKRIYDARKPKSDRKRGKGKSPLKNSDLTVAEWEGLQRRPGESELDHGRRYQRDVQARYRKRHGREKMAAKARDLYVKNGDAIRAQRRELREADPDRHREYTHRYLRRYPERAKARIEKLIQWGRDNPERLRAARAAWRKLNRALCASYSAAWRKQARIATPPWADPVQMLEFYVSARRMTDRTGVDYHVDHIVPLNHDLVCGLHVQNNMRVITGMENCSKSNKLIESLALDPGDVI